MVGVGVGWSRYIGLPGALRMDWATLGPLVVAFGGLCAVMLGLGLGGGLVWAVRARGARTSAPRLAIGAAVGAAVAGTLPAMLGIGGFGQLHAPFMGTANILGSSLLAAAAFVALFAPSTHREHTVGLLRRLGLSALASSITAATLGGLAWLLVQELALTPSFYEIVALAERVGLWTLSAWVALALCSALGVFVGLATWVYMSLMLALKPCSAAKPCGPETRSP